MTALNYLKDTFQFDSEATFLESKSHEMGTAVILDGTIFYPQGGGQPADKGKITSDTTEFVVTDVRLDEDGTVWHFGSYTKGEFAKGDKVKLQVDGDYRTTNAKLHSAGHLIDCAVSQMGLENLTPQKGFHFPDGPYVEYDGTIENPAELVPDLQARVDELVKQGIQLEAHELSPEEAQEQHVWAPPGKPARVINFAGFKTHGCGGTHINTSSQIGKIVIRKMKSKKGKTRVAYSVE